MKIILTILSLMVAAVVQNNAQSVKPGGGSYEAYLGSADVATVKNMWKSVVAEAQTEYGKNEKSSEHLFLLCLSQFGLLNATMRDQDESLFDDYIDDAEENIETLIEMNKKAGEPKALLSALYGLKMAYSPWKGMYLGPRSGSLIEDAKAQAPGSALVWKLYANSKLFTPETFGGDIKEAIRAFEKSISLYQADPESARQNWFYLDTIAFLGQAYMKDGQTLKAIAILEKALTVEPQYAWVKMQLLPQAKRQLASN